MCDEAHGVVQRLARPHVPIRIGVGLGIALLVSTVLAIGVRAFGMWASPEGASWLADVPDVLQGVEAGINDLVFVGFAVWSLTQIEVRWKRSRALGSLRSLRALAHIIDMHQLTKDPEIVLGQDASLAKGLMGPDDLVRYLDDCSDALAIIGKVAALHVQGFDDAETLAAVGEIEDLSTTLAQSIRQKIATLDRVLLPAPDRAARRRRPGGTRDVA